MVIFGGLELVAAGYVLHELRKDEEKPRSSEERRRRHRHGSHSNSHHRRDSDNRPRPPRPDTLAPPIVAPLRPNSAPPQQTFQPPHPGGGGPFPPGPWMNQMPIQQKQQNPPFPSIPHPQTWPHPSGGGNPQIPPSQQNPSRPMYLASDFPPNPHAQQQQMQPQPQRPPPPGPGNLTHQPTLHFDMKTGKWQSDMLPPEMPRSGSVPAGPTSRNRSASLQPPSRLRQERRQGSGSDSYSSSSDSSDDDNLAYGSLPGERRRRRRGGSGLRFVSRERQRPPPSNEPGRDRYGTDWDGRTASMPAEMPHQMRYELQG
jgi:hypothetical protein